MSRRFLSVVSLLLVTSVVVGQSPKSSRAFATYKSPTGLERATGAVAASGVVKIDGAAAISGQTLFSGDTVQTATGSTSTLSLINSARFKLGSETSLRLEFSRSSLSGSIEKGHIDCLSPAGVGVEIKTVDASIVTDASQPAAFTIEVESCATTISVWNGRIDLRTANGARSLTAGERFSTGDAPPIPGPQQNLNKKTKIGLVVGIGAAVTVLLVAMTGKEKQEDEQFGGCVVIPSGESQPCR